MQAAVAVLTADDVAALLACEVETVNAAALAGDLPGIKRGRRWVFPARALDDRLNELAQVEAAKRRAPAPPRAVVQREDSPKPPRLPRLA